MNRLVHLLAAVLLVGLAVPEPVRAMPVNFAAFGPLDMELARRLDEDLIGILDRTEKKQQRAVKSTLKKFAKPARSLSKDLKTVQQTSKKLAKAYPDEFPDSGTLGTLYTTLLDDLETLIDESRDVTAARAPAAAAKPDAVLAAGVAKADAAVAAAAAETAIDRRAKQLSKAAKALEAANKKASKKRFGDYMTAAIDGVQFVASDIVANHTESLPGVEARDIFDISGSFTTAGGDVCQLTVSVNGLTRKGTYPLDDSAAASIVETPSGGAQQSFALVPDSGELVIKKVDLTNRWIEGTFSFETSGTGGTRGVLHGAFGAAPSTITVEPSEHSLTFEWDGNVVQADVETISIRYVPSSGEFTIEGGRLDQQFGLTDAVTIAATGVAGPATFTVGVDVDGAFQQPPSEPAPFASGSLVIQSLDVSSTSASGSFSFTAMRGMTPIAITNGTFATTQLDIAE